MASASRPSKRARTAVPSRWFDGRDFYLNRVAYEEDIHDGRLPIAEIVEQSCVSACFLSSLFQNDDDWFERNFGSIAQLAVVVSHEQRHEAGTLLKERYYRRHPQWKRLSVRPSSGGLQHSKLMLLRMSNRLRVVVASANLGPQWDIVRETVWIQDFPLKQGGAASPFGDDLRTFCTDLVEPHADVFESLLDGVDFTSAEATLVASVPGRDSLWIQKVGLTGYRLLNRALKSHLASAPWPMSEDDAPVIISTGSLGDLKPSFLKAMEQTLVPEDGMDPSDVTAVNCGGWETTTKLRILFPTNATALASSLQRPVTCRAMLKKTFADVPHADRERLFFDAQPCSFIGRKEGGVPSWGHQVLSHGDEGRQLKLELDEDRRWRPPLAHAKVIFRGVSADASCEGGGGGGGASASAIPPTTTTAAWAYVGSHNFSKAAWGQLRRQPHNIELGVLLSTTSLTRAAMWRERLPYLAPAIDARGYGDLTELQRMFDFGGTWFARAAKCNGRTELLREEAVWIAEIWALALKHRVPKEPLSEEEAEEVAAFVAAAKLCADRDAY